MVDQKYFDHNKVVPKTHSPRVDLRLLGLGCAPRGTHDLSVGGQCWFWTMVDGSGWCIHLMTIPLLNIEAEWVLIPT